MMLEQPRMVVSGGGDGMLKNLQAEMTRFGVTNHDIGAVIGKAERTVRDKVNGVYAFDFPEAVSIRETFFPGLRLEYLFFDDGSKNGNALDEGR